MLICVSKLLRLVEVSLTFDCSGLLTGGEMPSFPDPSPLSDVIYFADPPG